MADLLKNMEKDTIQNQSSTHWMQKMLIQTQR